MALAPGPVPDGPVPDGPMVRCPMVRSPMALVRCPMALVWFAAAQRFAQPVPDPLAGARLAGARLAGARLAGARLSGARLSGARLSGCRLPWPGASFPASWRKDPRHRFRLRKRRKPAIF